MAASKAPALTPKERNNRETWLNAALHQMRPLFKQAGIPLHNQIRISVGFPLGGFEKIAGQCFKKEVSSDKHNEVFISPLEDDAAEVLGTLIHELIHAQDNCASKHGPKFAANAKALGLQGKPTHAGAGTNPKERKAFKQCYAKLLSKLGAYPHAALRPGKIKRQGTRLLKVQCSECGYIARVSSVWLDGPGAPICPTDEIPMEAD